MLKMSESIRELEDSDISDNLLHYQYNTKHLASLIDKGIDREDPIFLSSYRSFEGEVFENFIYEKLLRYAEENDYIESFILKGYHQDRQKAYPNTLSISEKQQIVYRTKSREISEFDAMFITKNKELYFVEMTLVKSVLKLRKRLRKKRALLEIVFPNYVIKSLIILNDGASGINQFPDFCTVWFTREFSARSVFNYIENPSSIKLHKKVIINSKKMIHAKDLDVYHFKYYNVLSWITKILRSNKKHIIDISFLMKYKIQRYHNLYNKFYIGYIYFEEISDYLKINSSEYETNQKVIVAVEKLYTDEIITTFYIQTTRKKLFLYNTNIDGTVSREKKDPYGITVTEVFHINKLMDNSYKFNMSNIVQIKKLLKDSFLSKLNS